MLSPRHATTDDALGLLPSRRNALVVPRRLSRSIALFLPLTRCTTASGLTPQFVRESRVSLLPQIPRIVMPNPGRRALSFSQVVFSDYRPLCSLRELWNEVSARKHRRCSEHTKRPSTARYERDRYSSCLGFGDTYLGVANSSHRMATSSDGSVCGQGRSSHAKRSSRICDLNSFMGWPTPFASRGPRFSCRARTCTCRRTWSYVSRSV
jgi:hypothetical protein